MRAGGIEFQAQGVVRIMHPDKGMGVEFAQTTPEHRSAVEKFLGVLTANRTLLPELQVQPEGLELASPRTQGPIEEAEDPLLHLFYGEPLAAEEFHQVLRKQRSVPQASAHGTAAGAHA
jgi:hypothetical protein